MIRTLVTGYGYWGRVLVTNLLEHSDFFVAGVCDPDHLMRADAMAYHNLYAFSDLDEAIRETLPDLVVIASPIGTMIDAAMISIEHYAHVMIAKPGATTRREAEELIAAAETAGVTVTTDYTMLMSGRIPELCEQMRRLGGLHDARLVRECVGSRSSAPILLDMMVHDFAILCALAYDWRVIAATVKDDEAIVSIESDSARAMLSARRNATADVRIASLECEYGYAHWDQLHDVTTQDLVYQRLTNVARTIRGDELPDYLMMRRVAALLEDAEKFA